MAKALCTGLSALILSLTFGAFSAANAVTVTSTYSYVGDICDDFDADGGATGADFNDCNEIVQDGGATGLFGMELLGLRAHIVSDALFTLSVQVADLFSVGGGNNPNEAFGFSLDNVFLGNLFDDSTADEAAINGSLAASVQANIDASPKSDSAIDLSFSVAAADIAPIIQDGRMTAWFDFSGDVNSMRNIELTVNYAAIPLPAGGALLLAGLLGLGAVRRRKTA